MIGSPAALAEPTLEHILRSAATKHGLYVPTGALWGGEDIRRMAERGSLTGLQVTMRFPPESLKLKGELAVKNAEVKKEQQCNLFVEVKRAPRLGTLQLNSTAGLFVNFAHWHQTMLVHIWSMC